MALTKKQIVKKFLPSQTNKRMKQITWNEVNAAIDEFSDEEKNRVIKNIIKRDFNTIGKLIYKAVTKEVQAVAEMSIEGMLDDNRLNLSELEQLLT